MILEFAIGHKISQPGECWNWQPSVLRTCQNLREEGLPVLYRQHSFHLDLQVNDKSIHNNNTNVMIAAWNLYRWDKVLSATDAAVLNHIKRVFLSLHPCFDFRLDCKGSLHIRANASVPLDMGSWRNLVIALLAPALAVDKWDGHTLLALVDAAISCP